MHSIKTLAVDFMNSWECEDINNDSENSAGANKLEKLYESIFQKYSSYEDFVKQNLIAFNLSKSDLFILNGHVNFKELNNRNSKCPNLDQDDNSNGMINGNPKEHFKWKSYSSTLNFVNDLIFISEVLRDCTSEKRNEVLGNFLYYMNHTCLPSNVYIPIPFGPEGLNFFNISNGDNTNQMVLGICEDHAFCLSTKEKVPFHILVEVAEISNKNVLSKNDSTNTNTNTNSNSNFQAQPTLSDSGSDVSPLSKYEVDFDSSVKNKKQQNKSFFSSLFGCCTGEERHDTSFEEPEEELVKSKELSLGLYGNLSFSEVSKDLLQKSKYAKLFPQRKIISLIIKGGEDMRQDQFVSQVIQIFSCIFDKENLDIFLKPLSIITTGRGGIVETFTNTISLQKIKSIDFDHLKLESEKGINLDANTNSNSSLNYLSDFYNSIKSNKTSQNITNSLKIFYLLKFGQTNEKYHKAVQNFLKSLVGYSLLCYFLEIKDRNNGNILIDDEGHMIHIDFGFLLKHSPGNMNFEKAPFKFTMDFLELLEGVNSDYFLKFQQLFYKGFLALRKHWTLIISFIEIYMMTNSDLPCFYDNETISEELKKKFLLDLFSSDQFNEEETIQEFTNGLIFTALDNWRTKMYDNFQKYCVGVN